MAAIYPVDIKATCRRMHSSIFITGRASRFLFTSPQTVDPLCPCCKAYANTSLRSKINMTSFNWQRYFLLPGVQCFLEINTLHCIIQCIVLAAKHFHLTRLLRLMHHAMQTWQRVNYWFPQLDFFSCSFMAELQMDRIYTQHQLVHISFQGKCVKRAVCARVFHLNLYLVRTV